MRSNGIEKRELSPGPQQRRLAVLGLPHLHVLAKKRLWKPILSPQLYSERKTKVDDVGKRSRKIPYALLE